MSVFTNIDSAMRKAPYVALAVYCAVLVGGVAMLGGEVAGFIRYRDDLAFATDTLARLETRNPLRPAAAAAKIPSGSPYLEGSTASVAGAGLLQLVHAAIKRANGNALSSQLDLQGPNAKSGFVAASFSLEMEPGALQPFVYGLEAGMPFIFVDNLVIQAPATANEGTKLRIILNVSAQRRPGQ